jgi:tetratricopeptide (TPR) repeat protein
VRTQRQLARALRRRGDLERASRHYKDALDLEPGSAITHVELGEVYERRGRLQEAARHFEAASRIQPELGRARAGLDRVSAHPNGS